LKIVYLLLHDFRFASLTFQDFATKQTHFSKEYASRLSKLGHQVKLYVLTDSGPRVQSVEAGGFEIKAFRSTARFPPFMKFGNSHSVGVLKELDEDAPDLVHLHNYYLWNFPYLAPWVKRKGTPLVAQYHGADPVRRLKKPAYYPSLRLCDRILVPIARERESLVNGMGIPRGRVQIFPSTGVDAGLFSPRAPKDSAPLLLYVGRIPEPTRFRYEKAPQYLIPIVRALAKSLPTVRLEVVGDGPGLAGLLSSARDLTAGGRFAYLGALPNESLPSFIRGLGSPSLRSRWKRLNRSGEEPCRNPLPAARLSQPLANAFPEGGSTGS